MANTSSRLAKTFPILVPESPESRLATALREVAEAAHSPHTLRAYHSHFGRFRSWCRRRGVTSLPAQPAVVSAYLVELAAIEAKSLATVALALAAIAAAHRVGRRRFDSSAPEIRLTLKGLLRKFAASQRQAKPLAPAMIRDIIQTAGDTLIDRRDAALLALLFAGALRRSEISGLDCGRRGRGDGILTVTNGAIDIVLLRSKSRVEPATIRIPVAENPRLVAALDRWIAIGGITLGTPLFRSISKGGLIRDRLAPGGVSLVIKARIAKHLRSCGYSDEAAAADARAYSGHSGRVGLYVAAAEAGVPIEAVANLARHKSLHIAQRYSRAADQLRRAPSKHPAVAI